jgi:ParB family chromosome partitioning protein
MERAHAYRRLTDEFGLTQEAIASRVGRSQPSVANTLRLLSLPPEVQASLGKGRITEGHARALLTIDDGGRLLRAWKEAETKGLSVRATEAAARRARISREIGPPQTAEPQEIRNIEQLIATELGAPVRLVNRRGAGEIRISFFSPADLDRLLDLLTQRSAHSP